MIDATELLDILKLIRLVLLAVACVGIIIGLVIGIFALFWWTLVSIAGFLIGAFGGAIVTGFHLLL